jgi:hypothetical protein
MKMTLKDIDMDHEFVSYENGQETSRMTLSGCLDDDKTICVTDIFAESGRGRRLMCKSMSSLIRTGSSRDDPVLLVPVTKDDGRISQTKLEKWYESLSFRWNANKTEMRSTLGEVLNQACQSKTNTS